MKRIISLILCVVLIFPGIYVGAEEEHTFYEIKVDAGEGIKSLKALVDDGEIYISANDYSKFTRYTFNSEDSLFLVEGQEVEKAFKWVHIDAGKKKIRIGLDVFDLDSCYEIDDNLYLPLCQMLPILSADIFEIKDGVIYISNNKISLAEILYDFDVKNYLFDLSEEFNNSTMLTLAFVVPSYAYDSITTWRYDRLDVFTNFGDYKDFKEIFTELLKADNLYLKAKAQDENKIAEVVELFTGINGVNKNFKSIFNWVETAGETETNSETAGKLLDILKAGYESGELEENNIKQLNDIWNQKGTIADVELFSISDVIEIIDYAYTYATQVEDNRKMLNAVYKVDKKITNGEVDRIAAKQIYDLYGEKVEPAIVNELAESLVDDGAKLLLKPYEIYAATAKVAGLVINSIIPYDAGDIAKLPMYSNVVFSSASKYHSYSVKTDEDTQNKRLSLLLCMLSSRKCFEIMKDTFEGAGKNSSYYQGKIEKIDKLIMALYMAEENTEFDSYEHFEDYKSENRTIISQSCVLNNMQVYAEKDLEKIIIGTYECLNYENYLGLYQIEFKENNIIEGFSGNRRQEYEGKYQVANNGYIYIYFSKVKYHAPTVPEDAPNVFDRNPFSITMRVESEGVKTDMYSEHSALGSLYIPINANFNVDGDSLMRENENIHKYCWICNYPAEFPPEYHDGHGLEGINGIERTQKEDGTVEFVYY